jgi:uncharacterized repeat protein (TIGR01451 family)
VGTLGSGSQATVTITGMPLAAPLTLSNRASTFSDIPDPTVSNNSMKVSTKVTAPEEGPTADLSLIKNDDTDPVTIGAPFTYTLTITNHGPDTAPEVIVTETLPPEVALGSATPSQGTCTGSRELICQLGSLKEGTGATVTIDVIPTTLTTLISQARVTSGATDPTPENNRDSETTLVQVVPQVGPNLVLTLRAEMDPVKADQGTCPDCRGILSWDMSVINQGDGSPATDVKLVQVIPDAAGVDWIPSGENTFEKVPSDGTRVVCTFFDCDFLRDPPETCTGVIGDPSQLLVPPLFISCPLGNLALNQKFSLGSGATMSPGTHSTTVTVTSSSSDPNSLTSQGTIEPVTPDDPFQPAEGGGCFIATAAFGSPLAKEVQILRHFRDQFLLPYQAGQLLVRGYYFSSPPLAAFIEQYPVLKEIVRVALWPVVWWAHLTLNAPYLALVMFLGGLIITMSLLYYMFRVWQRGNDFYFLGGRR